MPPRPPILYAISDIHIARPQNLAYFSALPSQKDTFPPNSGLILAGDVGETAQHLRTALEISLQVFKYVWWVPGNHELYTLPQQEARPSSTTLPHLNSGPQSNEGTRDLQGDILADSLKGQHRYLAFVDICRSYDNVFTPEDEWRIWDTSQADPLITPSLISLTNPSYTPSPSAALICPLFTLYDYTFRPDHLATVADALAWAQEADIYATDEALLHADPYPDKQSWSEALITKLQTRLATARARFPSLPLVLINHWPLSEQVLHIPRIARFSLWCGSRRTAEWTREFAPVKVVVSGHLHVKRTDWITNESSGSVTRWEEVSLGYPHQWTRIREDGLRIGEVLREILPGREQESYVIDKLVKGEGWVQKTSWRSAGGR